MKKIINLFFVILMVSFSTTIIAQTNSNTKSGWYAPDSANTIENPLKDNKESIKKGKALFNQLCTVCHGYKGKGDGMAGAALVPKPTNLTSPEVQNQTDGAIYWKLAEGKTPMASYKEILSEEERWHLVNFIRTLNKN